MTAQLGHYFGRKAIARRMRLSPTTLDAWIIRLGFPVYTRYRGPRHLLYTHEGLILIWELSLCKTERAARLRRKAAPGTRPERS